MAPPKTYFVLVTGIPGMGKTYLCSLIASAPNVVCVDSDDIYAEILEEILKDPVFGPHLGRDLRLHSTDNPWKRDIAGELQDRIIDRLRQPGKHLVIVGISLAFEPLHLRNVPDVQIEMGVIFQHDEFLELYRRYMQREVSKLERTLHQVAEAIKSLPTSEVDRAALHLSLITRLAGRFPRYFIEYREMYFHDVAGSLARGIKVMTQEQLATQLPRLFRGEITLKDLRGRKHTTERQLHASPFLPEFRAVHPTSQPKKKPKKKKTKTASRRRPRNPRPRRAAKGRRRRR